MDTDGNTKSDINDDLQKRILDEYNVTRNVNMFMLFRWPNVVAFGSGPSSNGSAQSIGYIMQPWTSAITGRAFCPTQEHYNGTDPLFRVMKEAIGVDTEGLYIGEREPLVMVNDGKLEQAKQDIIFIRENLLHKIWFYYENGQHFIPNEITAGQKSIMFYWPDIVNPYIRKSTQYIYIGKVLEEQPWAPVCKPQSNLPTNGLVASPQSVPKMISNAISKRFLITCHKGKLRRKSTRNTAKRRPVIDCAIIPLFMPEKIEASCFVSNVLQQMK